MLLTQPTRELVDVQASDLGEHRLKDLLEPQRLFQIGREEFPPLKTLDWTNLPVQATPLVGRERELAEAGALLREQRFLTVVGPPGSGKTRLALQLAADAADDFEHVWWVGLQEVHDSDLVEPTIAHVVGARTDLAGFLRDVEPCSCSTTWSRSSAARHASPSLSPLRAASSCSLRAASHSA